MIKLRSLITGAALVSLVLQACRDAPAALDDVTGVAPSASIAADTVDELPVPAEILTAWTDISFYDGSRGGQPVAEIRAGMTYYGNRAQMATSYSITGEDYSLSDKIVNYQDSYYIPWLEKRFEQMYTIPTNRNCGLLISARTQHEAWWFVFIRGLVDHESTRAIKFTLGTPLQIEPCEPVPPPDGSGEGGDSGGRWITIETCYYWAHYVNNVLVDIELRYCEYDQIPVADQ